MLALNKYLKSIQVPRTDHNRNVLCSRGIFLFMVMLEFSKYKDSNNIDPLLDYQQYVYIEILALLAVGLAIKGLWIKCGLWLLASAIATVQIYTKSSALSMRWEAYALTVVKFVYVRLVLDLLYRR